MKKGVITGCDENQEWLLKWWWENYSQHNSFPVTFFDFGLSKSARLWVQKRMPVITIDPPPLFPKSKVPLNYQKIWEKRYGSTLWEARSGWAQKPFAFAETPYDENIWLDIDCQVLKPLDPLFECAHSGMALAYEVARAVEKYRKYHFLLPNEKVYNTGVVPFLKSCPLIPEWIERTRKENHLFLGDQDILCRIIHEKNFPIHLLPDIYNRHPQDGCTPETVILHFVNNGGKSYLLKHLRT